jgi:amino acid permease
MSSSALIMMISYCSLMTITACYFFFRVLTSKKKTISENELDQQKNNVSSNSDK